jgi:predicted small integral membrane protein
MFDWMAWTVPVGIAFSGIFLMITGMTIWGHLRPPPRRKGFLQIVTDRGERLYIAILVFALIMVLSFAVEGLDSLLVAFGAATASAVVLKWG